MQTVKQWFTNKTYHDVILARLEKLTEETSESRNLTVAQKQIDKASCDSETRT